MKIPASFFLLRKGFPGAPAFPGGGADGCGSNQVLLRNGIKQMDEGGVKIEIDGVPAADFVQVQPRSGDDADDILIIGVHMQMEFAAHHFGDVHRGGEPFSGIFSRNRQMHGTDAYDHAALRLRLLREHGLLGGGEGDCPAQQFYPVDAACLDKAGRGVVYWPL